MIKKIGFSIAIFFTCISLVFAWGSWGHQHINYVAIFALPAEMRTFFYNHKDFLIEESVVPDLRKYTLNDKSENPRHYIDVEDYTTGSIDALPQTMAEAKLKYKDSVLSRNGILPWYIQEIMGKLTNAMKNKRKSEILFLAGDLGHYIGDANMPLHTSSNHDGQLTGQKGIHSLWESQLPDYYGDAYNFKLQPAVYLPDVTKASWDLIKHTHGLAESLLAIDRQVRASVGKDEMFKKDVNGVVIKNKFGSQVYSQKYTAALHTAMNGMVEKQLTHAMQDLTNFWYTAWVNAGKPDLTALDPVEVTKRNAKNMKKDLKLMQQGKVFGFKIETEFEK